MKSAKPYPVDADALAVLQAKVRTVASPKEVVADLRSAGFDKIDSIKFLREHAGITLHDAKGIVHLSPAWSDCYASDEAFHDAAEQALHLVLRQESIPAA